MYVLVNVTRISDGILGVHVKCVYCILRNNGNFVVIVNILVCLLK